MTASKEQYVHYVECIDSLNRAWRILQDLRANAQKTAIRAAAFRFALVEYAKPYADSDGIHQNRKKRNAYKLPSPDLPPEDCALHQQLLDLRHKVLAHSDLTLKEATVYVGHYGGRSRVTITSNILPSLPDCDVVIALIERILDSMYIERAHLEEILAQPA